MSNVKNSYMSKFKCQMSKAKCQNIKISKCKHLKKVSGRHSSAVEDVRKTDNKNVLTNCFLQRGKDENLKQKQKVMRERKMGLKVFTKRRWKSQAECTF